MISHCLLLLLLPGAASQVFLQRWCPNSLRVRLYDAALGAPPSPGPLQALVDPPTCDAAPPGTGSVGAGGLVNGNLAATAAADGTVSFVRVSDGVTVLAMAAPPALTPLGRRDTLGNALYSGSVAFLRPGGGALPVPEEIYGLGEHKTGRLSYGRGFSWQFEESQRRATFADNSDISLPLFTSSVGYTFVWNLPSYGGITINATHIELSSNATPALDFWLSVPPADVPAGTPPYASLSSQLVAAIGRPSDLPEWATGFWQSKLRYRSQAELLEAARGYAARGLPLSAIVIDYLHWPALGEWRFIPSCWPDPTAMTAELAAQGVVVVVSVWPQVDPQSSRLPAMLASNLLIRNASGLPWFDKATHFQPGYLVDATNPDARAYQWGAVEEGYFNHGIAAYWLDAAEPQGAVPGSMTFWAGEDLQVGMAYPRENSRTFFEGLASRGVRNGLTLSRSAWIGSQSVGGAVWSGDIFSNWSSFEQQIYIAQNMALSGNYLWTTDIGGFHSGNLTDPSFIELIQRWFQFGCFCPLFRLHGVRDPPLPSNACGDSGGNNEVWSFGPEAEATLTSLILLRDQLKEYITDAYLTAQRSGVPILRPMVYDFPDPGCVNATDQFLFGGAPYVVAPVYAYGARARDVYLPALPAGRAWQYLYNTTLYLPGGAWVRGFPAPLSEFPVFRAEPLPSI